jgi:hypothetical protein
VTSQLVLATRPSRSYRFFFSLYSSQWLNSELSFLILFDFFFFFNFDSYWAQREKFIGVFCISSDEFTIMWYFVFSSINWALKETRYRKSYWVSHMDPVLFWKIDALLCFDAKIYIHCQIYIIEIRISIFKNFMILHAYLKISISFQTIFLITKLIRYWIYCSHIYWLF